MLESRVNGLTGNCFQAKRQGLKSPVCQFWAIPRQARNAPPVFSPYLDALLVRIRIVGRSAESDALALYLLLSKEEQWALSPISQASNEE
jgi:hypothetical protein